MSSLPSSKSPILEGVTGSLAGHRIVLPSRRTVIGRDPERCDLVFAQNVVSKRHARLEIAPDLTGVITDLDSRYGTYVNGQQVKSAEFTDGDRIGFGPGGALAFIYRRSSPAAYGTTSLSGAAGRSLRPESRIPAEPLAAQGRNASRFVTAPASVSAIRIGRAPDNDIVLDSPAVSRHHASLVFDKGSLPVLVDEESTNGTYINGELVVSQRPVSPEEFIFLGGFLLHVEGRTVSRHDLSESRISAVNLTKEADGKTILSGISLAFEPREFVGVMGPSGCGKSTLMNALSGLRPATSGCVFVNNLDLYRNFDAIRRSIGFVPQRDILHDALSVERTLIYAARLRLPEGTPEPQLRMVVEEVIETVGLSDHRKTLFRCLSGGQQKRLSLAVELLTKPSFIFLDEPTSPLDPETTENMMRLFRRLADEGRIVVMVTHRFERFDDMSQVAILTRGGRLAFFGPPREALEYFSCREPGDAFKRVSSLEPETLEAAFAQSPQHEQYVAGRIVEAAAVARTTGQLHRPAAERSSSRPFGFSQWLTLTRRYLEIKLKDTRNTALLFAQAPVVAGILAMITAASPNDHKTLFIAAIVSIWFGANNAVREIVSEAPIYVRERLVSLKIPSYVMSKFVVLSGVALIQCVLFIGILILLNRLRFSDILSLTLTVYLTSLGGIALGLFFSALVNSSEKAMSLLPLILIPQLLLSGYLKPLDDVYVNVSSNKAATVADFKASEEARSSPKQTAQMPPSRPTVITRTEGLGAAGRAAASLMIARWSVEGLVNAVSIKDAPTRDALAIGMSVLAYDSVLEGKSESEIESAYVHRWYVDLAILSIFCAFLLCCTMSALRRKDVL